MLDATDAPSAGWTSSCRTAGRRARARAVGHPLEGDGIAKQLGVFTASWVRRSRVRCSRWSTTAAPERPRTTSFDDEGTQGRRNVLIREGVLVRFMTDILSAKQLKMDRTGNGRRESFRYLPIPRMTNTFIDRAGQAEDILASTKQGSTSGAERGVGGRRERVFNFTCREAYLIENGRKTAPIRVRRSSATASTSSRTSTRSAMTSISDRAFAQGSGGRGERRAADHPDQGINVGGTRARG